MTTDPFLRDLAKWPEFAGLPITTGTLDSILPPITASTLDSLLAMTKEEDALGLSSGGPVYKAVAPKCLSVPIHPSSVMSFDPSPAHPELSPVSFSFLLPGFLHPHSHIPVFPPFIVVFCCACN